MARILLIDDEKMVRETFRAILEAAGHVVDEAADGQEGIDQFRKQRADLIITDIFMPEQEGIGTILEIRRFDRDLPIIAVSGGGNAELSLSSATKLGATTALHKPVRRDDLLAAVDKCLGEATR
jgi:two-component system, chemotaxis family, chemotaxis protein CheY